MYCRYSYCIYILFNKINNVLLNFNFIFLVWSGYTKVMALNAGINIIGPVFARVCILCNILITNLFWSKYKYAILLAINKPN